MEHSFRIMKIGSVVAVITLAVLLTMCGGGGKQTSPGITIDPTNGLLTSESGNSDSFSVVLNSEPESDVSLGIYCNDTTEGTVDTSNLTFTSGNWNIPQTVTVRGVDDPVVDGNQVCWIITDPAVSNDSDYNGFDVDDVSFTNIDDDSPGITVNPAINVKQGSTVLPSGSGVYMFSEDVVADGDGGCVSGSVVFTIENQGEDAVMIFGISLTSGELLDFDLTSDIKDLVLPSGSSTTFSACFDPLYESGMRSAIVTIFSTQTAGAYTFTVRGYALKAYPEIHIREDTTNLPDGSGLFQFEENGWIDGNDGWSSSAIFRVENQGLGELNISSVSLTSGNTEDFDLDTSGLDSTLAPASSTYIKIYFDPLQSVGLRSATVSIESNDQDEGTYTFTVEGFAIGWRIRGSDVEHGDEFGYSIAISGDKAIVGSRNDYNEQERTGSAYLFHWSGSNWVEQKKLVPSDVVQWNLFGHSVGISGNVAIVGAQWDDDNGTDSGSAYLYHWNGADWVEQQKITASDGAAGDEFGLVVAINGDRAIVGARQFDDKGNAAYIFAWNGSNWIEQQKLVASDGGMTNDFFGISVAINGDRAIVGAPGDNDNGDDSGSAYIYHWNGTNWVEQQKITASNGEYRDSFGSAVAIEGDRAIIGATQTDNNYSNAGSVYFFQWNGSHWAQQQEILASDAGSGDFLGNSVSMSGDRAVFAGDWGDSGKCYLFKWTGSSWEEQYKILSGSTGGAVSGDTGMAGGGEYAFIFDATIFD